MSPTPMDGWQPSPPVPPLEPGTVHVWRLHVPTQASPGGSLSHNEFDGPTEQLSRHLTDDEQIRLRRFRQFADRARFASGRGLLRALLGHYLAAPPAGIRLRATPAGKPEIDPGDARVADRGLADLQFNVSHSGEWILIAMTRGVEVGVDVEAARSFADLEALTTRFFAPAEAAAVAALPAEARTDAFFRIWTRKEAFVKATGEGIAGGLDAFTVSHEDHADVRLQILADAAQAGEWTLRALTMPAGYAAAVAVRRPTCIVRTWEWRG